MLKKSFSIFTVIIAVFLSTFIACKKCDDLPAPTVTVTSISTTAVKATWNKIEGADSYEVVLANESLASKADIKTTEVTTTEATFDGITVKTAMVVKVTPRCKNGKLGTATGTSAAFVPTTPCDLLAPTKISVSPLTATTAKINWTPVQGAIGYQITVKDLTTQKVQIINTQAPPTTLDGLIAGTKYEITVAAKCGNDSISPYKISTTYEHFIIIDDTVIQFGTSIPSNICIKNGGAIRDAILTTSGISASFSNNYAFNITDSALGITGGSCHVKVVNGAKVSDFKFIYARFGKEVRIMPFTQCTGKVNYPTKDSTYPNTFTSITDNIVFTLYADRVVVTNNSATNADVYIED